MCCHQLGPTNCANRENVMTMFRLGQKAIRKFKKMILLPSRPRTAATTKYLRENEFIFLSQKSWKNDETKKQIDKETRRKRRNKISFPYKISTKIRF